MATYSLKKSKKILLNSFQLYLRKVRGGEAAEELRMQLEELEQALLAKDRSRAAALALALTEQEQTAPVKGWLRKGLDLFVTLAFALGVAVLIRQMFFELYEVPTGSMRPTIREHDRLLVAKTTFGLNMPLSPSHLYFDPDLVQRGGIVTFTGAGMDIPGVDTRYFYLFPGKKQYVKRLIGKPGDLLYFYGGKIYGVDREGRDLSQELQSATFDKLHHIPFIDVEGRVTREEVGADGVTSVLLSQMHLPIARLSWDPASRHCAGSLLGTDGRALSYGDLWGIGNYAQARLLTKQEVARLYGPSSLKTMEEGLLYLELKHAPDLNHVAMREDGPGQIRPALHLETSLLPLQQQHLDRLFEALYTARFDVVGGRMVRYGGGVPSHLIQAVCPKIEGVPEGRYEWYEGKPVEVLTQGFTKELASDHPLNRRDAARLHLLFNSGIECLSRYLPVSAHQSALPSRFAYFYEGELYVMGAPVWKRGDPLLSSFVKREQIRAQMQAAPLLSNRYIPFLDGGAPLKSDGSLDLEKLERLGLRVPDHHYLVLGDNHAMSADSRDFGFVPEGNLRGAPECIFWPFSERTGPLKQPGYSWWSGPRGATWAALGLLLIGSAVRSRRKKRLPLPW